MFKFKGPTKAMMNDFWRMVWQQKAEKLVMLTKLVETEVVNICSIQNTNMIFEIEKNSQDYKFIMHYGNGQFNKYKLVIVLIRVCLTRTLFSLKTFIISNYSCDYLFSRKSNNQLS